MLRITRRDDASSGVVLALEGRLVGEWVPVLQGELATAGSGETGVVLDVSRLQYANSEGVAVLLAAETRGVALLDPSPLLRSLLTSAAR